MNSLRHGGCLCGTTRYELSSAPDNVCDCHCIDCRKSSGAAFVTWGTVKRAEVRVVCGEARRVTHASRIRCFAACCGTPLFFEDAPDSDTVDVTIATLDEPEPFAPDRIIWLEDQLSWVALNPALPRFQRSSREG